MFIGNRFAVKEFAERNPLNFAQEMFLLRRLKHPNIIEFVDMFEVNDIYYLVMKLATRGDLAYRISAQRRSRLGFYKDQIKHFFYQIASGMRYLHKQSISHRDLKPGNVLIAEGTNGDDVLKIADFGLSNDADKSSALISSCCGTPVYMAPEVLDREMRHYKKECDLWSMGCILFELWYCSFLLQKRPSKVQN